MILSKYDLLNGRSCFHQACTHSAVLSLTENKLCILLGYVCLKLYLTVNFWAWFRVHWSLMGFGSCPLCTFLNCWCLCYQNISISMVSKASVVLCWKQLYEIKFMSFHWFGKLMQINAIILFHLKLKIEKS